MTYLGAAVFLLNFDFRGGDDGGVLLARAGRADRPWWRAIPYGSRVPPAGGLAGTLPTNFTRFASCAGALA